MTSKYGLQFQQQPQGFRVPTAWGQPATPEVPLLQSMQDYGVVQPTQYAPTTDYGSGANYEMGNPMGGGLGLAYGGTRSAMPMTPGTPAIGGPDFWSMKGVLGGKNADDSVDMGWGGLALGAANGLMQGYMGMKQYGLAKESLAESKRQFQLNYDAQKTITNSTLEDRQRSRIAANPKYESVASYMGRNGIR